MGVPAIRLSEKARKRLGLVSAAANFSCIIPSLMLFGLGGYMQVALQDKVDLIKGFHGHYLPHMIISLGFIYLVVNLAGGKICLDNSKPNKRKRLRLIFATYIYVSTIMCVLIIISAIFCFVQIIHLQQSFHDGISSAMKKYRFSRHFKETIDKLQIELRCCGNTGYADWFSTPWIDEQYLALDSQGVQSKMTSGHYLNDDTPFSCCDVEAIRPCIHHRVLENHAHYNYNHMDGLTLYTLGCRDALMEVYGHHLLTNVGIIILVISILQLAVVICARFLQTSTLLSLKKGNPTASADGWLIPWPNPKHDVTLTAREEKTLMRKDDGGEQSNNDESAASTPKTSPETGKSQKFMMEDQSYSSQGPGGPAVPPPLPPSFGAAFNESNNHSNVNFHNVRRFPPTPFRSEPPRLATPERRTLPPVLPPPPPPPFAPNRRSGSVFRNLGTLRQSVGQDLVRTRVNFPFRRHNNRQLTTTDIPLYQNGFTRNRYFN